MKQNEYNENLKVLQVIGGSAYGGGTEVVFQISQRLVEEGYHVSLVANDPGTVKKFEQAGIPVIQIPSMNRSINPLLDLLSFVSLVRVIKKGGFDIVHTHTSKAGVLGRIAGRLSGSKVLHHIHGFAFHERSSFLKKTLYINIEKFAAKFCDLLISVNAEDRKTALDLNICSPEQIVSIENGVRAALFDLPFPEKGIKDELGISRTETVYSFVGRLAEQKNPLDFVRAAAVVHLNFADAHFVLVGTGPLDEEAKKLVSEHKLEERVHLLGFRKDVPEILLSSDVFVLPSLWEGLPISILEAMALSRPIIATDVKGNRELLEDRVDSYMVPGADPEALAEAMMALYNDPVERNRIARNAREKAKRNFHEEQMLGRIVCRYAKAAQEISEVNAELEYPIAALNTKA